MASCAPCSVEWIDIGTIRPAPYNPRRIEEGQFRDLCHSLSAFGCIVPILVNRSNRTIIAGHQRTKAMRAIGMERAPCFMLDGISDADEMLFNQYHNSTDFYNRAGYCRYSGDIPEGEFTTADPGAFRFTDKAGAAIVETICGLLLKHGNCLSAVLCGGIAVAGANYVKACALLGLPVNCYRVGDAMAKELAECFARQYGTFCYDGIERRTYIQGLAQMYRKPDRTDGKRNASSLYEQLVIPALEEMGGRPSVLDFGCGMGAYVRKLAPRYDILGLEFYNHNKRALDVAAGNRMIDALVRRLRLKGLFDVVVCDSVLNSVDSMEAEHAVLTCVNAFSSTGRAFVSGRTMETMQRSMDARRSCRMNGEAKIYFTDADGFSAKYRNGSWFFQHFHTRETAEASLAAAGFRVVKFIRNTNSSWQTEVARVRKPTEEETERAIRFEFDLPLPGGERYGRDADVLAAFKGRNMANG